LSPLASPFLSLVTAVVLIPAARQARSTRIALARLFIPVVLFMLAYHGLLFLPLAARWLKALESPVWVAILLVVLPAMHLPRNGDWRWFRLVPACFVALLAWGIWQGSRSVPPEAPRVIGILVRPGWLIAGVASVLVLIQPFLSLNLFRRAVHITALCVLAAGGFMLRQDYTDFRDMRARRTVRRDVMNLSETSPVMGRDGRLAYLPSAPCRFSPDGGYIQGCNMELSQRILQLNYRKIAGHDVAELGALEAVLAAFLSFTILSFLVARWCCGWLCPLSTMGDGLDWLRHRLGVTPIRAGPATHAAMLGSGGTLAGIGLAMSALYHHLDATGRAFGVRIPVFPFCKMCPSQQICPMINAGPAGYPPLPGTEWAFGFFRYGCLIVLALYVLCFAAARRLWCRFCPMGMISGLFNRGGSFMLRKDAKRCNGCGMCAEACPMNIGKVRDEMQESNVSTYDCVLCLRCVAVCPRDGCLALEHEGHEVTRSHFGTGT